nr:hypothetical protein [Tanacetum cinerariifolium]
MSPGMYLVPKTDLTGVKSAVGLSPQPSPQPSRVHSRAESIAELSPQPSRRRAKSTAEDNTRQPQMSDMIALLNDLSYILPNNEQNEPNQGDIGETSNEPNQAKCNEFEELYASANEELYPGYDYVTRLDFMAKFTYFKVKERGKMQHMVDGRAWKNFDKKYPNFAKEPRNVRLRLAADGFNLFDNLSQAYSMWPTILTTYNLPLWPLIDDLKVLRALKGVETIDVATGHKFNMRAMVLWTINDFPAQSSLSGWSGQGYKACPTCNEDTPSMRILGKTAYVGHKRLLKKPYKWRRSHEFNGEIEDGVPLGKFDRDQIQAQLFKLPTRVNGKHPSYEGVKIKLNVTGLNDLFFTSLSIDTAKARQGLKRLGIRSVLWLGQTKKGKCSKPQAAYSFAPENRKKFCQFIKGVKLLDGFGSNFKHKVTDNDTNIMGLKSHDCHIMMQRLLPYGLQHSEQGGRYSMQSRGHIYPPAFFDIMIHSVIHLPLEAFEGGPIRPRWIFPFERFIKKIKGYVRNKAKLEGSIAEGYAAEEALTFSSLYFRDVTTKFNRPERNVDPPPPTCQFQVFRSLCKSIGLWSVIRFNAQELKKVMWYVLHNSLEIDTYRSRFKSKFPNKDMKEEFPDWFGSQIRQHHVDNDPGVSTTSELFALACGLTPTPISVNSCVVNGVRFVVHSHDERRITQNSGICSPGGKDGEMYYCQLQEILEFSYLSFKVVLFRVKWFDTSNEGRKVKHLMSTDVAWGHGGDSGDDDRPPTHQRKAARLHTRQETRNLGLKKNTDDKGPVLIRFKWDDKKTLMPLGDHASHWSNYLGELIREMPLYYLSWQKVLAERKATILTKIGTQFELTPHMNQARTAQNRQNRAKSTVVCRQGSRLLARLRDQMMESSATREYPSLIHTFFVTHTVNGALGSNTPSGVPYTKEKINVLPRKGKQRRHLPGVGRLDTFYNALNPNDQDALDSAAGGNFLDKIPRDDKLDIRMNRFEKSLNDMKAFVTSPAPIKAQEFQTNFEKKQNDFQNMMMSFMQNLHNNKASSSSSLPSNTIPNRRIKANAITTRSGISYDGPPIPPPVMEKEPEATKDTELPSTENIQPPSEVKNVVEQPAERRTRIVKSLQNFRVIHTSSISLNNTSQISPVHAVAPILSTKEPEYSPSMGYEHPNTIPKTESGEVIKSGVEELVPILSENEVTSEDKRECDMLVYENSPICDNHSEIFSDSKNDNDEQSLTLKCGDTPSISYNNFESLNKVHLIDATCKEYSQEVLGFSDVEELNAEIANTIVESFPSSLILVQDSDSQREDIDIVTNTNELLPPGFENDDLEGEIDVVEELHVDDSISNSEHELSDNEASDFDNPSFPRPPPE